MLLSSTLARPELLTKAVKAPLSEYASARTFAYAFHRAARPAIFSIPTLRVEDLLGTPHLHLVTEYRYEPVRNKLLRQIDAEGKVTDHALDDYGNRVVMAEGRVATALPDDIPASHWQIFKLEKLK